MYTTITYFQMGKILRILILIVVFLIVFLLLRLSLINGAIDAYEEFFYIPSFHMVYYTIPVYVSITFGSGIGSVVTLSSLNHFKTNIMRTSWIICIGQALIIQAMGLLSLLLEHIVESKIFSYMTKDQFNVVEI